MQGDKRKGEISGKAKQPSSESIRFRDGSAPNLFHCWCLSLLVIRWASLGEGEYLA